MLDREFVEALSNEIQSITRHIKHENYRIEHIVAVIDSLRKDKYKAECKLVEYLIKSGIDTQEKLEEIKDEIPESVYIGCWSEINLGLTGEIEDF